MSSIREYIQKIAEKSGKGNAEIYSVIAKVTLVDSSKYTCDVEPLNGDIEILGVKLKAGIDSNNQTMVCIPKVGSNVICTFINDSQAYVALCDEVDKIEIKSSQESLKSILEDLISAIEKVTVTTAMGPSGTPINIAEFTAIKNRIPNLLKD